MQKNRASEEPQRGLHFYVCEQCIVEIITLFNGDDTGLPSL